MTTEIARVGCGTNLVPSATSHLPGGHSSGKHLAGTIHSAIQLSLPLAAVGFTCQHLAATLYSNHMSPSPTLPYTGMSPDTSVVASYIPLTASALGPIAPTMRTPLAAEGELMTTPAICAAARPASTFIAAALGLVSSSSTSFALIAPLLSCCTAMVTVCCGPNLVPLSTTHLPRGQSSGKHLAGTAQEAKPPALLF